MTFLGATGTTRFTLILTDHMEAKLTSKQILVLKELVLKVLSKAR
jgi:hypothetical protein